MPEPHRNMSPQAAAVLFLLVAISIGIRCGTIRNSAIDHFDEGVYSANRWFADTEAGTYPLQHFYAPPLLPVLIDVGIDVAGFQIGPLLPALVLGCVSVVAVWFLLLDWVGIDAAIAGGILLAANDFHAVYSQHALTDVPMGCWFLLAVWQGTNACLLGGGRRIVVAGIAAGLCWWTKYNGWLPLAVVGSGLIGWKLAGPFLARKYTIPANFFRPSLWQILIRWTLFACVAGLVWSPVYLQLPNGYSEIAANHAGYFRGFSQWFSTTQEQLQNHDVLTGLFTMAGIFVAFLLSLLLPATLDPRFTWNGRRMPGGAVCLRVLGAGVLFGLLAGVVGSGSVLFILAVGGMLGTFRWSLRNLRLAGVAKNESSDDSAEQPDGKNDGPTAAQPVADGSHRPENFEPRWWVLLAWLTSMTLVTPLYQPYPRITVPWLLAVILCAGVGVAWWTRALRNVLIREAERRAGRLENAVDDVPTQNVRRRILPWLAMVGMLLVCFFNWHHLRLRLDPTRSFARQSRTGLKESAERISKEIAIRFPNNNAVTLVFGEPALLYHLNANGVPAMPIGDLRAFTQLPPQFRQQSILITGPHADETSGFTSAMQQSVEFVDEFFTTDYQPSIVPVLNQASLRAASIGGETVRQTFHVYRLR